MVGQKKSVVVVFYSLIYKFFFSSGQRERSDFHKQLKTDTVRTSNSVETNMEL